MDISAAISIIEYNGYPTAQESIDNPMIDFLLLDMEHLPYDMETLRTFLLGLNSKREVMVKGNFQPNLAVFIRLPADGGEPVHTLIKQALDMGVHGVVIPHVRSREDALKIVKACRYAQPAGPIEKPLGNRGASPWLCAYQWGVTMEEYVRRADVWPLNPQGDIMAIIMIEDEVGVRDIKEILDVPGISAVIFGPYDYSFSSGNLGNTSAKEVIEAQRKVKNACDKAGIPFIGFANPSNIERIVKENYKMLLIGTEVDQSGSADKVIQYLRNLKN
jgi:4-hydroxy-2-oxoheptanedioate aldolase